MSEKANLINMVSEITSLLYARPERAKKVLAALHKGLFDAAFQDPKEYFSSQYKFMYRLPKAHLAPLLNRMHPDITPEILGKFGPQAPKQMFFFAMRVTRKHKLFSMKKSTFDEISVQRHTTNGSPLRNLDLTVPAKDLWKRNGVYKLLPVRPDDVEASKHVYKQVQLYAAGAVADLPEEYCVWGTWHIEDNFCWKSASLHSPKKNMDFLHAYFQEAELNKVVERPEAADGEQEADDDDDEEADEECDEDKPAQGSSARTPATSTPAKRTRGGEASPASLKKAPVIPGASPASTKKPKLAVGGASLQDALAKI